MTQKMNFSKRLLLFRILYLMILTLLAIFMIFFAFSIIPGDAALLSVGQEYDEKLLLKLRSEYGLDRPLLERFVVWVKNALQGDLGISTRYKEPVIRLVLRHAMVTLRLTLLAFTLTILFAFSTSFVVVALRRRRIASIMAIMSQIFLAIPQFWLAMVMIQVFSLGLGWFQLFSVELTLRDFVYPALVMAFIQSAYLSRYLISAWKRETNQRYVMSGLARGLPYWRLRILHALPGSLIPTTTILGLIWIDLLSGSIIIENLFTLPGLGQLLVSAVSARDLPLVQGITLYFVFVVVLSNIIVEFLHYQLNPRLEEQ